MPSVLLLIGVAHARSPLSDSTDVLITPPTLFQMEPSVSVSPENPNLLIVTANTYPHSDPPVYLGTLIGAAPCWSADGGRTWTCQGAGTGDNPNRGDPACAIGRQGRFYSAYMKDSAPLGIDIHAAFTSDPGSTWTAKVVRDHPDNWDMDRPHLWVNNNPNPQDLYRDYVYAGWSSFDPLNHVVEVAYSRDQGENWIGLNELLAPGQPRDREQGFGVSLQTGPSASGPNSNVYAAWTLSSTSGGLQDAKDLAFARSTNGGALWPFIQRIQAVGAGASLYVRGAWDSGLSDDLKFPNRSLGDYTSMAVDTTTGYIYVAWTNHGDPMLDLPKGSLGWKDTNIYVIRSTNYGDTWDTPVKVNQDVNTNPDYPNEQWFPWITWDDCTGALAVIFYDTRDHPWGQGDHAADTYVAYSMPQEGLGTVWHDFKVNNPGVTYSCLDSQANDYNGIDARDGRVFPVWAADSTLSGGPPYPFKLYTSPFYLWGVPQSTVTAGYIYNQDFTIDVTVTWETNLEAWTGDKLILKSPSSTIYTSPVCTDCTADGLHHSLTFAVPCEPGNWKVVVESSRAGCQGKRRSDEKKLRVLHCEEE